MRKKFLFNSISETVQKKLGIRFVCILNFRNDSLDYLVQVPAISLRFKLLYLKFAINSSKSINFIKICKKFCKQTEMNKIFSRLNDLRWISD